MGIMGELIYGACRFEDAEEMAEATNIPVRFIQKRMKEGKSGEEIVRQYRKRQELLENVKYLGLHM